MKYKDTSKSPFVLVDVDGVQGIDLSEVADSIASSKTYPAPIIRWRDDDEAFSGDISRNGKPGLALTEDEMACKGGFYAIKAVRRVKGAATFLITTTFPDVPSYDTDSLVECLKSTITHTRDGGGKRLVLLTSREQLEKHHPGLLDMLGKLNPGLPVFEQPQKVGAPSQANFRAAMATPAPPDFQAEWPWADNPEFIDALDALTPGELSAIIQERLHEPALMRVLAAMQATQKLFCNRDHAVEIMVACAIARVNLVYLGPPGTAKSELVRAFARTLGVRPTSRPIHEEEAAAADVRKSSERGRAGRPLFEYLLTRYTTPEELFGGADIDLLLNKGVHGRRTAGMLPQAEIGFLDELFKANTAILNALLSLTNERLFYNMGQAFKVNLAFVVGASNETPAEEELGALYDRFPIRVPCLPVNEKKLLTVVQMAHDLEREKVDRLACLNDIRLLAKIAWVQESFGGALHAFPPGDDKFKNQFESFLTAFRQEFRISDRTPYRILRLCRALGLLDRANFLGPKQLRAWGYVAPRVTSSLDLQQLVRKRVLQEDENCGELFDLR